MVAIGASAGGLAAFTALLKALPSSSGMAFVLIQRLEPKHESALTSQLSKATSMPVVEVSHGMAVEPNCVYVIPPNRDMTIHRGTLRLAPRSAASGYPCHSSTQQRWFLMTGSPLKRPRIGAMVAHTDITDLKLAEVAAEKSQLTIRALLDSSTQSVIAVGADEKIILVNGNTEKMFGYKREELVGQGLDALIPESLRARHSEHYKAFFGNPQTRPMGIGLNLEARRKDGTVFPVEVGLSAIETAAGKLAVAFVSDITQRRQMEQAVQAQAKEVQALAASLLRAQEDERRRVSVELHDRICQQLASLAFDMGKLVDTPLPEGAQRQLKALQARAVKASEETRHIACEMHSPILDDLGLVASMRDLCHQFSELNPDIALTFTEAVLPAALPREVGYCLYRITQECLRNIAKHAGASRVSVALTARKGALALTIADNGAGFDPNAVKGIGQLGLIGMKERLQLIKGNLSITTRPRHGTRISLKVVLPGGSL